MNKLKWKQSLVGFPDLGNLEMSLKMLCVRITILSRCSWSAGRPDPGPGWATHLWWTGRGQRCTPGSCSHHSHRVPRRAPGTPRPPGSTPAAPPLGGARLPAAAPLSRVGLPVGTHPTGRREYSNAGHGQAPLLVPVHLHEGSHFLLTLGYGWKGWLLHNKGLA